MHYNSLSSCELGSQKLLVAAREAIRAKILTMKEM